MEDKNLTTQKNTPSFEKINTIKPLGYMLVIVDKYLEDSMRFIMKKNGCSAVFIKHGYGSATKSFYESNHLVERQKSLLFSLVTENDYYNVKEQIIKKLNTNKFTKGVVLFKKLSSIGGVTNYKFFSHHEYVKEVK
jgi:hypothetical protein